MADNPPQQLTAPLENAWVRFCRWLWKHRGFMWGTVVLGVVLNLLASWLITPAGSTFSNTPLGPRVAQRDYRLARISLTSGVVYTVDLVAIMGWCCFPRDEMNATKRELEVPR